MTRVSRSRVARLIALFLVSSLPALLAPEVGARLTELVRAVDTRGPYLATLEPLLLYILMPLSVLGACALVMAPGLLLALALGRARDLATWIVDGFLLSLLTVSVAAGLVQLALGRPLTGAGFFVVAWVLILACGVLALQRARTTDLPWPLESRGDRRAATWLVVVPLLLLVVLTPKVFWESLSGDGAHAFWATRLLLFQAIPFFPPEVGLLGSWPGVNGLTYPYAPSWFMRLFGEVEASVRLPFFLLLPILHASIVSLVRVREGKDPGAAAQLLIGGSLLGFALIMAYSATYNPYMADMSMPGVMDALVMILAFAAYTSYARGERLRLFLVVLLGLMASPAALTMLGFMLVAVFLTTRPLPWRHCLGFGLGLLGCMVLLSALGTVFELFGTTAGGDEHGVVGLLRENYAVLSYGSFERFGYVILACGIYPIASFVGWGRADAFTRSLLLVALAQFGMFFVMGAAALHYFVPAMLIPVVAFWRLHEAAALRRPALGACAAGVAISVALALPASTAIHMTTRELGEQIEVVGYDGDGWEALGASTAMRSMFQLMVRRTVPDERYGGSPAAWVYYALFTRDDQEPPTYGLVRAGLDARRGEKIGESDGAEVYVYDAVEWERRKFERPLDSLGRSVFVVPRDKLFAHRALNTRGAVRTGAILERITGNGR